MRETTTIIHINHPLTMRLVKGEDNNTYIIHPKDIKLAKAYQHIKNRRQPIPKTSNLTIPL